MGQQAAPSAMTDYYAGFDGGIAFNSGSAGGGAGGGGAGGLWSTVDVSGGGNPPRAKIKSMKANTTYAITVGAGGAGGANNSTHSANGSPSKIVGGDLGFVLIGGGGGGCRDFAINRGWHGGSGGGGGQRDTANDNSGKGIAGQGFDGGIAFNSGSAGGGAGGGGAGGPGANCLAYALGSGGGAGLEISITGETVRYAAGGGGAGQTAGGYIFPSGVS